MAASSKRSREMRPKRHFLDPRRWHAEEGDAGLMIILILQATVMFIVAPLAGASPFRTDVLELFRFGVAATAILIVNPSRLIAVSVGVTFVVPLLCTALLRTAQATEATHLVNICGSIAFELTVCWTVARAAFDPGRINLHRIMGAVILYLYAGLIFASLYHLAEDVWRPAFSGLSTVRSDSWSDLLYFSLGTLTSAGYGDILPVHPFVRGLCNLEAVIGQLYPATFLARLVTLEGAVTERRGRRRKEE